MRVSMIGRVLKVSSAVILCRLVAALPPGLTPAVLLPFRYKYRQLWVRPALVKRKHGPAGRSKASGAALNKALRRSFVVRGEWDWPGREIGHVPDVDDLVHSFTSRGYDRLGTLRAAIEGGIQVCIARDGALVLFNEGHHRIVAAKKAGLDAVPVYVRGVHLEWAERQRRTRGGSLAAALDAGLEALTS